MNGSARHTTKGDVASSIPIPDHELIRQIGGGSYGEVWLARNVFATFRAVKIVHRKSFEDDRPYEREFLGIQRFEPISRAHEGFLDILQVGRNDAAGYFYYVMELADDASEDIRQQEMGETTRSPMLARSPAKIEGVNRKSQIGNPNTYSPKTVKSVIRQRGRLPTDECVRLGLFLTAALAHLHRSGLIHRDIKPSNIIFVEGVPKLADIGLVASSDATRSLLGTEGFIPPEGSGAPQGDLYSLGKVLYEISTGRDRQDFPEPPTELEAMPERQKFLELNEVILKACAWDPRERYQSAEEMHADLALIESGKSLRRLQTTERRLAMATKIGMIATLVALVVGGLYYQAHRAEKKARQNLARVYVANGTRLLDEGDALSSLPWLAEALRLEQGIRAREETHRIRIGAILRDSPRLIQDSFFDASILCLEFNPDRNLVVTISDDGAASLYDAKTRQAAMPPLRHSAPVMHAALSPDAQRLITSGKDGAVRIWDVPSGKMLLSPVPLGGPVNFSVFSPDGRRVASVVDSPATQTTHARIWDASTGELLFAPLAHTAQVLFAGFSSDNRVLITAGADSVARLWDTSTGQMLGEPLKHNHSVSGAFFSPDAKRVATASRDGTASVWDAQTGKRLIPPLQHQSAVCHAAFSPDGLRLATASEDRTARVWDTRTGVASSVPLNHSRPVRHVAFSPDGRFVVTVCDDFKTRIWDATTGELFTPPLPDHERVLRAWFDSDGRHVFTLSERGTRIWDLANRNFVGPGFGHSGTVLQAAFAPSVPRVATVSADGTARVWHAVTGESITPPLLHRGRVMHAVFSPDGSRIVTTGLETTAHLWDAATGKQAVPLLRHNAVVQDAAFSPDGQRVITASQDHTAQIWDVATGRPATPSLPHQGAVNTAVFSPDGRLALTASEDGIARIWDASSAELSNPALPHDGPVKWARFSPDGKKIVTGSVSPGDSEKLLLQTWDARTRKPTKRPFSRLQHVFIAAFSHNGHELFTCTDDTEPRIWNLLTGQAVTLRLPQRSGIASGSVSSNGRLAATTSRDGLTRVWDTSSGELVALRRSRGGVQFVEFSPDNRLVVTGDEDGAGRVWDLTPAPRNTDDLVELAQMLAGQRVDASGTAVPMDRAALRNAWQRMTVKYARPFPPDETYLWHRRQAKQCERAWQLRAALFHLSRAIQLKPNLPVNWLERALVQAELMEWEKASDDYYRAIRPGIRLESDPASPPILALVLGDFGAFNRIRTRLFDRFADTEDSEIAQEVIWSSVLMPSELINKAQLVKLAEKTAKSESSRSRALPNTLGAALYRARENPKALRVLSEAVATRPQNGLGFDLLFLAMTQARLGHDTEAKQSLEKAVEWKKLLTLQDFGDPEDTRRRWQSWVEFHVLYREAKAVLARRYPNALAPENIHRFWEELRADAAGRGDLASASSSLNRPPPK